MPTRILHYLGASVSLLDRSIWAAALAAVLDAVTPGGSLSVTLLVALLVLVVLDTITGVAASWREGQPISSARMRDTASKLIGYGGAIAAVGVALLAAGDHWAEGRHMVTAAVAAGFCFAEVKSIFENVGRLGVTVPQWVLGLIDRARDAAEQEPQKKEDQ